MTAEQWEHVQTLFLDALDRAPDQREAFLEDACKGDPQLHEEVLSLLEAADEAEDYFTDLAGRVTFPAAINLPPISLEGKQIGPYQIIRRIGRGGMGAVYLAERADGQFEKQVALKLLPLGMDAENVRQRFLTERQILATLTHPNIAGLLDGGTTDDGRPYLVLEYVDGTPITDYCNEHRCTVEERLDLFIKVARAVQHAHDHGVVHRDLKPSNILMTGDGTVKLLDFGIAKLLEEAELPTERPRTGTGVRLMTPEYASPEQMRGEQITPASDVYQLGILLYELLAGTRPHDIKGKSPAEAERIICGEEPRAPSAAAIADEQLVEIARTRRMNANRLRKTLQGDLDTIILQALRKEPERRYDTAGEMAEDIQRYRMSRPVAARPTSWTYRARKFLKRNRVPMLSSAATILVVLALVVLGAVVSSVIQPPAAPVIAVGEIRTYGNQGTGGPVRALRGLLATSLARVPKLHVVSTERLYAIRAGFPDATAGNALARAAQKAGADQIITGDLHYEPEGEIRLDLQRIDLETSEISVAYRIEGTDPFALVDRATARIAADFDLSPPRSGIADVTTTSLVAYRSYQEGVRAYYDGDNQAAYRLLSVALEKDSTFAMAWYYRALSNKLINYSAFRRDLGRAVDFADQASDRERLLIKTAWAREMDEPRQLALAETLATRYPNKPAGHLFLGEAKLWSGQFMEALPHLRHVIAMDSLSIGAGATRCFACDALDDIATAYMLADSLPAAERAARRWVQLDPGSARAWRTLATMLEYQGQSEAALAARERAAELGSGNPRDPPVYPIILAIRAGNFDRADRLLAALSDTDRPLIRQNVLWYKVLSYRYQGRFHEALEVARRYRRMLLDAQAAGHPSPWQWILIAQVLLEMGRPQEAATLWREMSIYNYDPDSEARSARHRAWTLTQAAAALAAAGDTAALPALADTIQVLGQKSAYGRDPLLHHYVRGLLMAARGDTAAAATRFRRAIFSTTAGYGRINLELGRMLLALDRPHEAASILSAALHGPLDAGNFYVNRTSIHALLARAYQAAGQPESAAVHAEWVARARGTAREIED